MSEVLFEVLFVEHSSGLSLDVPDVLEVIFRIVFKLDVVELLCLSAVEGVLLRVWFCSIVVFKGE